MRPRSACGVPSSASAWRPGRSLGGLLLEHFAWGSVFWALVPLALVTAIAAYLLVPESRDPAVPPLDLPGLGISVLMLGTLTWTIIEAPDHGWHSPVTLAGFVVAALSLVVFVDPRADHAHTRCST